MRHKWNRNSHVGVTYCNRCGHCREYVRGAWMYFRNDICHHNGAPKCDRLIVGKTEAEIKALLPLLF